MKLQYLPSYSGVFINVLERYIFKVDLLLVCVATCHCVLILVFSNELTLSKLLKVLIIFPKLEVLRLSLESSHLIKNAHVSGAILWAKLLRYLL